MKKTFYLFGFIAIFSLVALVSCQDGVDGMDGDPGPSGFVSLLKTTTLDVGDDDCPNGGTRIDTGIDNGDGDGIAGNEILEDGEIDDTTFICNGSDGDNAGTVTREISLANFGNTDYTGFSTVSISDQFPDGNIQDETRLGIYVDKSADPDSVSRIRSLVKFDNINAEILALAEPNEIGSIQGATLYVLMGESPFGSGSSADLDFIEFRVFSMNGPFFPNTATNNDYVKSEVSWNEIAAGDAWGTPGLFSQSGIDRQDDRELITNGTVPPLNSVWYALRLDTARVADWFSDAQNRGMILSLSENYAIERGSTVDIEMTLVDMMLHLEVDYTNASSGGRVGRSESNIKSWGDRTEAERFTPLQRYLMSQ